MTRTTFLVLAMSVAGCSEFNMVSMSNPALPTGPESWTDTQPPHTSTPVDDPSGSPPVTTTIRNPEDQGLPPFSTFRLRGAGGGGDGAGDAPEGDVPEGDDPEGDVPEGDVPEGDVPEGDAPEGDDPEGDVPEGDVPEGDVPEGDVPEGDVPGDVPEGDVPEGDVPEGDVPEGDVNDGGIPGGGPGDADADPDGCTPGYWKQDQHIDSWPGGLTADALFVDVFGHDAFPGLTLSDVLGLGEGDLDALGRHAVAALLNSLSDGVDYPLTDAEVVDAFGAAWLSGDYTDTKNDFEAYNEDSCALA